MEPFIAFNRLDGRSDERVEQLQQVFKHAGVGVDVPADIQCAMWEKFLFIVAMSGMGAVTRAPIGAIRTIPETRRLLEMVIRECEAVGRAQGVALPEDILANTLRFIDSIPAGSMPSLQRDVMEGRPSELEAQTGALVRLGRECGMSTPINEFIYACLLPQEKVARGEVVTES
jgi:2-dehydropantoate 2-reductase